MRLVYADHHISPFETALTKFFVCTDHHISPFETALTKFFVCTDRHISPFEGGQGGCYIGTIQEEGTISEGLAKKHRSINN